MSCGMKYFKYTQISEETGVSWALAQPISGPSHPKLPGLRNILQLNYDQLYWLGEVDDEAVPNPENHCFEITAQERALELKKVIDWEIEHRLPNMEEEYKRFREFYLQLDLSFNPVMEIHKYQQALQIQTDPESPARVIRKEAAEKNISPMDLANTYIEDYNKFQLRDSYMKEIYDLIMSRYNNYFFDLNNPDLSWNEWHSKEKIGEELVEHLIESQTEPVIQMSNIIVGKYEFALGPRYNCLCQKG